jgi:O-antigen ligase
MAAVNQSSASRFNIAAFGVSLSAFLALVLAGVFPTDAEGLAPGQGWIAAVGGSESPYVTYFVVTVPLFLAWAGTLLSRRVIQTPVYWIAVPALIFALVTLLSVGFSAFRSASLLAVAPWLIYVLAFYAGSAILGRREGPLLLLSAIAGGGAWVAVRGIIEYGEMRAVDPTWRIFAGWINPNATAAVFCLALPAALACVHLSERVPRLLAGLSAVLISAALYLTQSKGGLLAAGIGIGVYLLLTAIPNPKRVFPISAVAGALVLAGLGLGYAATQQRAATPESTAATGTAPAASRLVAAGESQTQSAGFRTLLWRGATQMMLANPAGEGIGTYRFRSASSGLTTQTILAHNSYLQIGTETGFLGLAAFAAFALAWLVGFFRGARKLAPDFGPARAGIFGSIAGVAAHSFIDSDLHYFGIGLPFFLLLAAGLLVSADCVTPEYTQRSLMAMFAGATVLAVGWLWWASMVDLRRAQLRGAVSVSPTALQDAASALEAISPGDPDAAYWRGLAGRNTPEAVQHLAQAAERHPTPRNYRALADAQVAAGDYAGAEASLRKALRHDPHNLVTLRRLMDLQADTGNNSGAEDTARRLLGVEKTPYFTVRSIPEMVPTETYAARVRLADRAAPEDAITLLEEAKRGYLEFLGTTWPQVQRLDSIAPGSNFAGLTKERAQAILQEGQGVLERLANLGRPDADATSRLAEALR